MNAALDCPLVIYMVTLIVIVAFYDAIGITKRYLWSPPKDTLDRRPRYGHQGSACVQRRDGVTVMALRGWIYGSFHPLSEAVGQRAFFSRITIVSNAPLRDLSFYSILRSGLGGSAGLRFCHVKKIHNGDHRSGEVVQW